MTPDEMKAVAEKIIGALNANAEFSDMELMEFEPGAPLPIAFVTQGQDFVLELNVL